MATHRTHSLEFKRQVVQEFLGGESRTRSANGCNELPLILVGAQQNGAPGASRGNAPGIPVVGRQTQLPGSANTVS
jgi:hypothetical protein